MYGIHDDSKRYFWAAYHFFVLLSSLVGDTLILYASFQKDAFKLNKSIVSVLQHIAVSDLVLSFFTVLPATISLLVDSWVLGKTTCYVRLYITYTAYPAGMMFIAVMTTNKLLLLKYPQGASNWAPTGRGTHQICLGIWTLCLLAFPIAFFMQGQHDVGFDYRGYECGYVFTLPAWRTIMSRIYPIIFQFIPFCIIIGTAIPTLKYLFHARKSARRVQGSIPWQGAMTVVLTAGLYCLSNLPLFVYFVGMNFIEKFPKAHFT